MSGVLSCSILLELKKARRDVANICPCCAGALNLMRHAKRSTNRDVRLMGLPLGGATENEVLPTSNVTGIDLLQACTLTAVAVLDACTSMGMQAVHANVPTSGGEEGAHN